MKRVVSLSIATLTILVIAIAFTSAQEQKTVSSEQAHEKPTGTIPSSLDAFYPPKARRPIYHFKMLQLANPFAGIVIDLSEQDFQNVQADFKMFKIRYEEISKLVPEWEKEYPMDPVVELGQALGTGDQGKVMAAYEKVGKVCHDCHLAYMVKAQHKYHWKNVLAMKVKDPLTNQELGYVQFKHYMRGNWVGIGLDLRQGQLENAQKHFQGLKVRFQALKGTCSNCHDPKAEIKYYVDENVEALIDKLGQVLSTPPVDPKGLQALFQQVGMQCCFKCHLVHLPAAYAKY